MLGHAAFEGGMGLHHAVLVTMDQVAQRAQVAAGDGGDQFGVGWLPRCHSLQTLPTPAGGQF